LNVPTFERKYPYMRIVVYRSTTKTTSSHFNSGFEWQLKPFNSPSLSQRLAHSNPIVWGGLVILLSGLGWQTTLLLKKIVFEGG
jgi:hypothetical protein